MTRRHPPDDLLSAFADGDLEPGMQARVERHLGACGECRARRDALAALRADLAALPREIAPAPELWSGIRSAIEASGARTEIPGIEHEILGTEHEIPGVVHETPDDAVVSSGRRRERRVPVLRSRTLLAAAAVVLVLLGGAAVLRLGNRADPNTVAVRDPAAAARFAQLEAPYVAAAAELSVALERRRQMLPADVVVPFSDALAIVEEAVRETRAAVAADPTNDDLAAMALAAQRRKLELLQRVTQWSSDE